MICCYRYPGSGPVASQQAKLSHGRNSGTRKLTSGFTDGHQLNLRLWIGSDTDLPRSVISLSYLQQSSTMRHLWYVPLLAFIIAMGAESIAWTGQRANTRSFREQR